MMGRLRAFDEGRRESKLGRSEYSVPAPKSQYFMSFGLGLFLEPLTFRCIIRYGVYGRRITVTLLRWYFFFLGFPALMGRILYPYVSVNDSKLSLAGDYQIFPQR